MKKDYQKPMLISEEFILNEYVAACYNFKALFHCHYGENNTNNHGEPCATTYVDINGIHATGHEGTIEKWGIPILNIDWNGFDLSDAKVGDKIRGIKWTSYDTVNNTGEYNHQGWGEIRSAVEEIPGRPNHS